VSDTTAWSKRFQQARERLGLSCDELAKKLGIPMPCVRDIEMHSDELSSVYSPSEIKRFCDVLGLHPVELLGIETRETPIGPEELVQRIHDDCRSHGRTLEQFEDAVGWRLTDLLDPPERLLESMTIDGLQWLCQELAIDWRRVIMTL
jgi:hypothetical protein